MIIRNLLNNAMIKKYILWIVVAMIVVLSIGSIIVGITMNKARLQAIENGYLLLQSTKESLTYEFDKIQQYAMDKVLDERCYDFKYDKNDVKSQEELIELIKMLNTEDYYGNFFRKAYFYMASEGLVVFENGKYDFAQFYATEIKDDGESFESWTDRMNDRYYNHYVLKEKEDTYSVEYLQSYPIGKEIRGNIVIQLDYDALVEKYCLMYKENRALYVLDSKDNIIFVVGDKNYGISDEEIQMENGYVRNADTTVFKYGDSKFKCISVEKNSVINAGLEKRLFADICMIILLIVACLFLLVSATYRVAMPLARINGLIDRYYDNIKKDVAKDEEMNIHEKLEIIFEGRKEAEEIIMRQEDAIRNNLLKRFINAGKDSIADVYNDLKNHNINFNYEDFAVVSLSFSAEAPETDKITLTKYATIKLLTDAFENFGDFCFVDDDWENVIMILNFKNEDRTITNIVNELTAVKKFINKEFATEININIGGVHRGITGVRQSYKETIDCSEYRIYSGTDRVLAYGKLKNKGGGYFYNHDQEKEFIRHVVMGNEKKALDFIDDMIVAHQSENVAVTRCFFFNLLGTMLRILNLGNTEIAENIDKQMKIESLFACKSIPELREESRKIVQEICRNINLYSGNRTEKLKAATCEYVDRNYCDSAISLEDVANEFGLNYNYMSHFFREQIGSSFVEYITKKRVERIKELLDDESLTLEDIAAMVGYANSAVLIRNYKKVEGITPGQYRKSQKADEDNDS